MASATCRQPGSALNLIAHLLSVLPYEEIPHEDIGLPERAFDRTYERHTLLTELYVPQKY